MSIYEDELKNKDKSIPEDNADNQYIDNNSYIKVDDVVINKEEEIVEDNDQLINQISNEIKIDIDEVNYDEDINLDDNKNPDEEIIIPLIEEKVILNESLIKEKNSNRVMEINNPRVKKSAKDIEYIEDGDYSNKEWSVTLVLCVLLGFIGLHRFYVGKAGTAILMLLTFGGFGIWILVDLVKIIIDNFTDEEGKIVKRNALAS